MQEQEHEFSFKSLFVPFTTLKAIHWIIVIGVVVYANMLFNGFVWDDMSYILYNTDIHTINFLKIFGQSFFNNAYYRPIPALYFSLIYSFARDTSFFYHVIQITIQIINTIFIFLIFQKFFKRTIAFCLALVFLVHPIQVESVSYIAASDNPLFVLLGILAFYLSSKEFLSKRRLIVIASLLLLTILTKETGILFLLFIPLYRFLFQKKNFLALIIAESIVVFSYISIRLSAIGASLISVKTAAIPITTLPLDQRLINIPKIIIYYLQILFFPFNQAIDQQWVVRKISYHQFYLPLIIDIFFFITLSIFGFLIYRFQRKLVKVYLFFCLWFLLGLLMHLQIIPLDMIVADRFYYVPFVGLLGVFGVSIYLFLLLKKKFRISLLGVSIAVVVIIFLSVLTIIRNSQWINGITLYSHDSKINDNYEIENNLANEYALIQNNAEAIEHYQKTINMFPRETAYFNLADLYEHMGNVQKAKEYYYKALGANYYIISSHKHAEVTYVRLGTILVFKDNPLVAKEFVQNALTDYPKSGQLWYLLALSESKLGEKTNAFNSAAKAYNLSPNTQTDYIYSQLLNNKPLLFK